MSSFVVDHEQATRHIDSVFDKIKTLIRFGIWGNVSIDRFKRWQAQFQTVEEKFFAAYLAQQLVYYNKKDVIALLSYSFAQCIKHIAMDFKGDKDHRGDIIWRDLVTEARNKTLVCPLTTDSPAASGYMVSRVLRDQGVIYEHQLCQTIEELIHKMNRNTYKAVIFVDDMIGSGTQAKETYLNRRDFGNDYISVKEVLSRLNPDLQVFLSVAIAPERSIGSLTNETGLIVSAAEKLTERNEVINSQFWREDMYASGIDFLDQLEKQVNIRKVGFDTNSWAVTFEHGTPDNCCPFYFQEPNGWTSLVRFRGEDL